MKQIHKLLISIFVILILASASVITNAKANMNTTNSIGNSAIDEQIKQTKENKFHFPNSTPWQDAIKKKIANGSISASDIESAPEYTIEVLEKNESHIKLKSTTKITYKNPRGAGYSNNKWPKFEVKDDPELRKNGYIKPGNYDRAVKDYITSNIQNITDIGERTTALNKWNEYNFESGQRTETIEEIYEVTYPKESIGQSSTSTSNDILMGFTQTPHVRWITEYRLAILWFEIYYHKAGVEFDAAYGLRLPTEVNLDSPELMNSGQNYILSTHINGADWDRTRYLNANVPPENGNEFVTRFSYWAGIIVRILGDTIIDWHIEDAKDYGKSFKTPIGPSESFPDLSSLIPILRIGPDIANLGLNLRLNTDLSPDRITVDWTSNGDSIGNGLLGYDTPGRTYVFGHVYAGDYSPTTNYATIRVSNFKYYFDRCRLQADALVRLHILSRDWDLSLNFYNLNCDGEYLGTHSGTNANSVNENILVGSLLKNPGFEISDGIEPTDWDKYQTGTKAIFTYPETERNGDKSVSIRYPTIEAGKVAIWWQKQVTVDPSKIYKLSGYMKLEDIRTESRKTDVDSNAIGESHGAGLRVNWYKSDGSVIKVDIIPKSGTSSWTRYEKILTSPPNAVKANVGGDLYSSSGKVWFDDLSFVEIS